MEDDHPEYAGAGAAGPDGLPRHMTMSFDAERDISIFALDNAMENDRRLLARHPA